MHHFRVLPLAPIAVLAPIPLSLGQNIVPFVVLEPIPFSLGQHPVWYVPNVMLEPILPSLELDPV
jgi:hypothetical protein